MIVFVGAACAFASSPLTLNNAPLTCARPAVKHQDIAMVTGWGDAGSPATDPTGRSTFTFVPESQLAVEGRGEVQKPERRHPGMAGPPQKLPFAEAPGSRYPGVRGGPPPGFIPEARPNNMGEGGMGPPAYSPTGAMGGQGPMGGMGGQMPPPGAMQGGGMMAGGMGMAGMGMGMPPPGAMQNGMGMGVPPPGVDDRARNPEFVYAPVSQVTTQAKGEQEAMKQQQKFAEQQMQQEQAQMQAQMQAQAEAQQRAQQQARQPVTAAGAPPADAAPVPERWRRAPLRQPAGRPATTSSGRGQFVYAPVSQVSPQVQQMSNAYIGEMGNRPYDGRPRDVPRGPPSAFQPRAGARTPGSTAAAAAAGGMADTYGPSSSWASSREDRLKAVDPMRGPRDAPPPVVPRGAKYAATQADLQAEAAAAAASASQQQQQTRDPSEAAVAASAPSTNIKSLDELLIGAPEDVRQAAVQWCHANQVGDITILFEDPGEADMLCGCFLDALPLSPGGIYDMKVRKRLGEMRSSYFRF